MGIEFLQMMCTQFSENAEYTNAEKKGLKKYIAASHERRAIKTAYTKQRKATKHETKGQTYDKTKL